MAGTETKSAAEADIIERLTRTPFGLLITLIALVSGPLAFVTEFGALWLLAIVSIFSWIYWASSVLNAREKREHAAAGKRLYSWKWIAFVALLPSAFTLSFLFLVYFNISGLNFWRKDIESPTVRIARSGRVAKYFEETAQRTTPEEKLIYKNEDWVRWLEAGAKATYSGAEVIFIESEPFPEKLRTFTIEVHSLDKKLKPHTAGVAFLIHDELGDEWYRPEFRQVPCDLAGDAATSLFRVEVRNAEPGESLRLFLCVTPAVTNVDLDNLELQLKVR